MSQKSYNICNIYHNKVAFLEKKAILQNKQIKAANHRLLCKATSPSTSKHSIYKPTTTTTNNKTLNSKSDIAMNYDIGTDNISLPTQNHNHDELGTQNVDTIHDNADSLMDCSDTKNSNNVNDNANSNSNSNNGAIFSLYDGTIQMSQSDDAAQTQTGIVLHNKTSIIDE